MYQGHTVGRTYHSPIEEEQEPKYISGEPAGVDYDSGIKYDSSSPAEEEDEHIKYDSEDEETISDLVDEEEESEAAKTDNMEEVAKAVQSNNADKKVDREKKTVDEVIQQLIDTEFS